MFRKKQFLFLIAALIGIYFSILKIPSANASHSCYDRDEDGNCLDWGSCHGYCETEYEYEYPDYPYPDYPYPGYPYPSYPYPSYPYPGYPYPGYPYPGYPYPGYPYPGYPYPSYPYPSYPYPSYPYPSYPSPAPTVDIDCGPPYTDGPCNIPWNTSSTLSWTSGGAISVCNASGDWSGSKPPTGSESTGNLTQVRTYNYALTCTGPGGSGSDSVGVNVAAPIPSVPTVSVAEPDYCVSGPGGVVSWAYSDPSGSPQAYYQVQVDDVTSFANPEVDTGWVNSSSTNYAIPQGILQFNTTYRARVRVQNGYGGTSSWTVSNSWKTPIYAYPQVNFTWSPTVPQQNVPVQFTDQTVFGGGNTNQRSWNWSFGDGNGSTLQNPSHTYINSGNYTVTLTATDAANQSCFKQKNISVQKPIPKLKEVAPK